MVTLKDIAAEAGVSITTVSNVVHNRKSRVSAERIAKIWEIIEREHYVPSMTARSLANDHSRHGHAYHAADEGQHGGRPVPVFHYGQRRAARP